MNKTIDAAFLQKVKQLALDAAGIIPEREPGTLRVSSKGDKDFVTQVDLQISEFLCIQLPKLLPGSIVVSEEGDNVSLSAGGYSWIIDPIDGTTNLIYGLPLYAISIGLLRDNQPVLGVVYNPESGEMFSAAEGCGSWLGKRPIHVNTDDILDHTLVLVETDPYMNRDRNRSPQLINAVFHDCIDYRVTGSAALDICFIAAGRGGVFFAQTLKPWDYAGGSSILLEAGGTITHWDGGALSFAGRHGTLATNGLLHTEMLRRIDAFLANK